MKFVRDIIKEVCGLAPYEKRIIELLRIQKDKRALKFAKKRVSRRCIGLRNGLSVNPSCLAGNPSSCQEEARGDAKDAATDEKSSTAAANNRLRKVPRSQALSWSYFILCRLIPNIIIIIKMAQVIPVILNQWLEVCCFE